MPKLKTPAFRKLKPAHPAIRAVIERRHQQRVKQLVKTARLNGRMAKHFASVIGLKPENIPASLVRKIQIEIQRAMRTVSGGPVRNPRR
jgi:hypothetical protein